MTSPIGLTASPQRVLFPIPDAASWNVNPTQKVSLKSTEAETMLVKVTVVATRHIQYAIVPLAAQVPTLRYIKPNKEVEFEVMRGKRSGLTKPEAEDRALAGGEEWRDIIGIEAILDEEEKLPLNPETGYTADEVKTIWTKAIKTGKNIASLIIPVDHCSPDGSIPGIGYEMPVGADHIKITEEIEKPGNWLRFSPNHLLKMSFLPGYEGQTHPTKAYVSSLYWKPLDNRAAQECVVRFNDDEHVYPVKMAVKWLSDSPNAGPAGDAKARSYFGRACDEYRTWRRLNHEFIAPLVGVVWWPRIGFIAPYYTNGRLLSYIEDKKPDWMERRRLMQELAQAIDYLHMMGLVYGDLKEDNILIDHDHHVKLIDFGLTLPEKESLLMTTFTGHIRYLAPETGERKLKTREGDIYALGFVILEIAIGRVARLEHGADHVAIANAYYFKPLQYKNYPEIRQSDSNELWNIVTHCTERSSAQRPSIMHIINRLPRIRESDWMPGALRRKG